MKKTHKNEDEDVEFLETEDSGVSADLVKKLKKVKEELKSSQEEKKEYLGDLQRLKADFVNYKKDEDGRLTDLRTNMKERALTEFLEVSDIFSLAMADKAKWEELPEDWRRGMESVYEKLDSIFRQNGFQSFDPTGDEFDPAQHEPIGTVESEEKNDHKVVEVLKLGYRIGDRVVRPALVKIGEFKK